MELKSDHGGRCIGSHVELVFVDCEDGEQVTVRVIAWGRTGSAITGRAEVGPRLQRSGR